MSETRPFIPRQMDDAGLTAQQFRVVCRVARRGVCNESIPNIASGCQLAVGTVKKVLPFLVASNVLAKERRSGRTCIYQVRPVEEWRIEPRPKDNPCSTQAQPAKQADTKANSHPNPLDQTATHKGNPSEGDPKKGDGAPAGRKREIWQLLKDEKGLSNRLQQERESCNPDKRLIKELKSELAKVRAEMGGSDSTSLPNGSSRQSAATPNGRPFIDFVP